MKVLIIRCGALGDLVYATSVIDALKAQYGENTIIDFVSTPGSSKIFEKDSRIHHIFPLKHKKIPLLLSQQKKEVVKASKKEPYDLLINFEFGQQFRSLVEAIQAKRKVGALVQNIVFPPEIVHMVDIIRYMFKDVVSKNVYEQSFPRLIGTNINTMRKKYNLPEHFIIISPSNSHQKRNIINYRAWPNEHWKKLLQKLSSTSLPVVLIGNKNEEEFFKHLQPYPENVIDLVGKTPLSDLISVIELADALVATDTGTAHIASAVNTEVFALIGPTPANQTGPYQTKHNKVHIISMHLPCSPCYKSEVMKQCKANICMQQITPEIVYESILSAKIV